MLTLRTHSRLVFQPSLLFTKNVFNAKQASMLLVNRRSWRSSTGQSLFHSRNLHINNTNAFHKTCNGTQPKLLRLINGDSFSCNIRIAKKQFHNSSISLLQDLSKHNGDQKQNLKAASNKKTTTKDSKSNSESDSKNEGAEEESQAGHKELLRLFKLAKYDWKLLSLALTLLVVSCCIGMCIPKVIGIVLDVLKDNISKTTDIRDIQIYDMITLPNFLWLFAFSLLIGQICSFGRIVLLRVLGEKLVSRLRARVMKVTLHQDAEFFDRNKVGDLISRLGSDAYVVSRSITQNISDGCKAILCGGIGVGMMFSISTSLSAAVFIFAPLLMIGATIYGKKIRVLSKSLQVATGNLTRVAEEQLSSVKTVQSFVAENKELNKYNKSIRQLFNVGKQEALANATFFSSTNLLSDMSFLIVLAYGSHLALQGTMSIGDLTAFMIYTEFTGNAVYGLTNFYSELMKGAGAASRLFELTDRKPLIHSTKGQAFVSKGDNAACRVKVENLSFAYPTRPSNQIFNKLNFEIEPGSNACIVGPSGRGKSTITSLLLKYYKPSEGRILIDDQDLSKISAKSIRRSLGVVQQEPVLMSGSIRENISYGLDYEPTMDEIRAVAKRAFCYDFISKFPHGFETQIGPRGALLSGGQKQRISIARALLKNPKILILDEATSALDVESEGAINYTLGKLMRSKQCTIISIAHRLSTIRRSENIIVLGHDGAVKEMGKFKELYNNRESALYKLLNEPKKAEKQPVRAPEKSYQPQNASDDQEKSKENKLQNEEPSKDEAEKKINQEVLEHIIEDIDNDVKSSKLHP